MKKLEVLYELLATYQFILFLPYIASTFITSSNQDPAELQINTLLAVTSF